MGERGWLGGLLLSIIKVVRSQRILTLVLLAAARSLRASSREVVVCSFSAQLQIKAARAEQLAAQHTAAGPYNHAVCSLVVTPVLPVVGRSRLATHPGSAEFFTVSAQRKICSPISPTRPRMITYLVWREALCRSRGGQRLRTPRRRSAPVELPFTACQPIARRTSPLSAKSCLWLTG